MTDNQDGEIIKEHDRDHDELTRASGSAFMHPSFMGDGFDSNSSEDDNWEDARDDLSEENNEISEQEIREFLVQANELKAEGNTEFKSSKWESALELYRTALKRIPARAAPSLESNVGKGKERADATSAEVSDDEGAVSLQAQSIAQKRPLTDIELECATLRSVLNANIAACLIKTGDKKEAIKACTESLADDSDYVKALHRRAHCYDSLSAWSDLTHAEEDYKRLLEMLPSDSPLLPSIHSALRSLPSRVEAAKKQETDEMIGKLKGLGDNILGRFGLSTNNFQFTPNGQGGYSMNFVK
ncbi:hypothetical protein BOTBODRAFT_154087 [Botryobasidium botryosum FD-172 SS1]|uniref:TPR-like protein n=1 Tax=Botryobasidium botryosum (strain FD-172 SS1) TaxID=930990 RepID=A0A067N4S6_BOTB1|nr:hypothetical protein BOTBODRAFT_154087 [Botryobasidium botryosum FD-172 SS1]